MTRWRAGTIATIAGALVGLSVPSPAAADEDPTITTTSVSFVQGEFKSVLLEASPPHPYGDPCAYEWIGIDGFPAGIELRRFTGRLRGTPTTHGEYHPRIRLYRTASDECGPQVFVDKQITVTIAAAAPVISPGHAGLEVVYGQEFHGTPFAVTGGTPPYTYAMEGDAHGLSMDPATGEVSGTPTATYVEHELQVTVTDADGAATPARLSVNYNHNVPNLVVPFVRGQQYDLQVPLLESTYPPVTPVWSALSTPPPGMTLTADGRLVGTPTSEGATLLTAKALVEVEHWETPDNVWYETWVDTGELTIIVTRPSVHWTTDALLAPGRKGRPLERELTSGGGWGRHTYRLVRGDLPPGTELVRTGRRSVELSGTPVRAGTFDFRIRVRDAHDEVRGRTFEIRIRRPR